MLSSGKTWLGCSGVQLGERRRDLESWTNAVFRLLGARLQGIGRWICLALRPLCPHRHPQEPRARVRGLPLSRCWPRDRGLQPSGSAGGGHSLLGGSACGSSARTAAHGAQSRWCQPADHGACGQQAGSDPAGASRPSKEWLQWQVQPDGQASLLRQAAGEAQKVVLNISIPAGITPGQKIAVAWQNSSPCCLFREDFR